MVNPQIPSIVPVAVLEAAEKQLALEQPGEMAAQIREHMGRYSPTRMQLGAAIDAVFWAMHTQEEGRPTCPRIMFTESRSPACALSPTPFTVEALRKLSPLLDAPEAYFHVDAQERIVGVGPRSTFALAIAGTDRGTLVVSVGRTVVALLEAGTWHLVDGDRSSLVAIFTNPFAGASFPERFLRGDIVLSLANESRKARRGAMFVLAKEIAEEHLCAPRYKVETFDALPEGLAKWEAMRHQPLGQGRTQQAEQSVSLLEMGKQLVSAGAGIDGATFLQLPDLRPLGFGFKVNLPDDSIPVCVIELPTRASADRSYRPKKELGGMRHQSAARLVQHAHDATVISVSQDGTISVFGWIADEERVVMIKHVDRYLAAE